MSLRSFCSDDRERAVVGLWRRNHLSPGSIVAYLQWIRRFRTYCQRCDLDEVSQLTLKGVKRFTRAYVGPRTRGPVGPSSCFAARNALHAWACALRALQVSVPPWRAARPSAKLTTLLSAYIQYRRAHCGVAESTLHRDIETAKTFLALLPSGGKSIPKATTADIDRFVSHLSARYSKQTVADSCSSLRAFLRFLRITNRSRHDLAASVISPRVRFAERPPRALPWADVRRILGSIRQKEPPGKRDFAMLLMMATLPPVAKALAAYLQFERPSPAEARRIFLSMQMPYTPFTSGAIRHRIRHYARQAGIDAPVIGAHAFRHSHATRQIDAGANPKVVSDILGHRRPSSTSVYVRVALRRLRGVALPVPR